MRTWLYQRIIADPAIMALLPGGFHETSSLQDNRPNTLPYATYRMSLLVPEIVDDGRPVVSTQSVLVWVHDSKGDYLKIEEVLTLVKASLTGAVGAGIVRATWVQDSEDLVDPDTGDIVKNSQFELKHFG